MGRKAKEQRKSNQQSHYFIERKPERVEEASHNLPVADNHGEMQTGPREYFYKQPAVYPTLSPVNYQQQRYQSIQPRYQVYGAHYQSNVQFYPNPNYFPYPGYFPSPCFYPPYWNPYDQSRVISNYDPNMAPNYGFPHYYHNQCVPPTSTMPVRYDDQRYLYPNPVMTPKSYEPVVAASPNGSIQNPFI